MLFGSIIGILCSVVSFAIDSIRRTVGRLGTDRAPSTTTTTHCTFSFLLWISQCALRAFPIITMTVRLSCRMIIIIIAVNGQIYHDIMIGIATTISKMCIKIHRTRSQIHTRTALRLRSISVLHLLRRLRGPPIAIALVFRIINNTSIIGGFRCRSNDKCRTTEGIAATTHPSQSIGWLRRMPSSSFFLGDGAFIGFGGRAMIRG